MRNTWVFEGTTAIERITVRRVYRAWRTFHTKEYARIKATETAYGLRTALRYKGRWPLA